MDVQSSNRQGVPKLRERLARRAPSAPLSPNELGQLRDLCPHLGAALLDLYLFRLVGLLIQCSELQMAARAAGERRLVGGLRWQGPALTRASSDRYLRPLLSRSMPASEMSAATSTPVEAGAEGAAPCSLCGLTCFGAVGCSPAGLDRAGWLGTRISNSVCSSTKRRAL